MAGATGAAPERGSDGQRRVMGALERVVSRGLAEASERQRNLLRYLVTEELEGRGDRLKAFSIATDVFGRSADFDAQQDSIVRVEIGRLRKSLELYYATGGRSDQVRFRIDKGRYRPSFEIREPYARGRRRTWRLLRPAIAALGALAILAGLVGWLWPRAGAPDARSGPRIAVAPFAIASDRSGQSYIGAGLRAEMTAVLSEFDWLSVFPVSRRFDVAAGEAPAGWRADFMLKANVQVAGEKLIVAPLLLDGKTGAVRWSGRYETKFTAANVVGVEREIATRIAADVGQPFGIVANIERTRFAMDAFDGDDAYRCHLRALQFWTTQARDDFSPALQCAERLGAAASASANVRAMLALLLLDGARFAYDARPVAELRETAARMAEDAHRRRENGALPRMARYSAALCAGDVDAFRRASAAAVRDYPNNPATLLDVGGKSALGADEWEQGLALVARARALTSNLPDWTDYAETVDSLRRGRPVVLGDLHAAALENMHPLLLLVDLAAQDDPAAADAAAGMLARLGYGDTQALTDLLARQCWSAVVKKALAERLARVARR